MTQAASNAFLIMMAFLGTSSLLLAGASFVANTFRWTSLTVQEAAYYKYWEDWANALGFPVAIMTLLSALFYLLTS